MRPKSDDGEHAEQNWCGAKDCFVGPLALSFDAEMGADFLEGDFDLPAADVPGEDVARAGVEIGGKEGLWLEFASGIAHEQPTDRHGRHAARGQIRIVNLHNLPVLIVLACAVGGLAFAAVVPEHWLRGVLFMAGGLVLAGLFRLALPARQAGILAVRGRTVDVLCYVGAGAALWVVGLLIPPTRS